jgi:hypothetical protein
MWRRKQKSTAFSEVQKSRARVSDFTQWFCPSKYRLFERHRIMTFMQIQFRPSMLDCSWKAQRGFFFSFSYACSTAARFHVSTLTTLLGRISAPTNETMLCAGITSLANRPNSNAPGRFRNVEPASADLLMGALQFLRNIFNTLAID